MKVLTVLEFGKTIPIEHITGLEIHRQVVPHRHMASRHDDVDMVFHIGPFTLSDEDIKKHDIVQFLRKSTHQNDIRRCNELGVKTIFDIDDYWELPKYHTLYDKAKHDNFARQTSIFISDAHLVTTTTATLADKIRPLNKNVEVLPNCIDPALMKRRDIQSGRMRFGWIGGVHHAHDFMPLKEDFKELSRIANRKHTDNMQVCCGGYTPNDHYRYIEKIMTNSYELFRWDKVYIDYLNHETPMMEHIGYDKPYRRLWGTTAWEYWNLYNEIDVALVPLLNNDFNACKSELKIIEAGYFKKAVIVDDVLPYSPYLYDDNCLTGNWFDNMVWCLKNPNAVDDMGEQLHEDMNEHFNIDKWADARYELYKSLV